MSTVQLVRDYWNKRPCNIRHSTQPVGTQAYFDEVEKRKYFVEPHIPEFTEFHKWKGKKVLEIGCGMGTDSINFARAGADLTVIDLSSESLNLCKRRFEVYGLNARFYCGNSEKLSSFVPVEKYDLVYSFGVIHHTPYPERVISEIHKYMGPSSIFKIMVYHRTSWKAFWILMKYGKGKFWKIDKLVADYSEAQTGCPVTYTYTKKSVKDLLKGFKIEEMNIEHIFPYKISDYVQYKYKKVWYFRYLPGLVFRWFETKFGWHLCVTSRAEKIYE
ncbi:MAG: class I SAM-dependent methyltransferase [Desulfobacteria bacterium]